MKIINYTEETTKKFDGENVKGVTGRVVIGKKDGADHFCMRVFEIEKDGFTPKHSHQWEHEIFFHSGKGKVLTNGHWTDIGPGSAAFIPGNEEHQIKNNGPDKLVFVCLIPAGAPEI